MALSVTRANRIFEKAFDAETCYVPHLRRARPWERHSGTWVVEYRDRPAPHGWDTLNAAIAAVLATCWEDFDGSKLTTQERTELRAIPSAVAHLL